MKSVLQEATRLGGIVGAVSEKLSFSPEYQTALEIALGASSQHIIVEDEGCLLYTSITPSEYSKQLIQSYGVKTPIVAVSNGIDLRCV